MTFTDSIITAIIAGVVSLIVGLLSFFANKRNLDQQKIRTENDLKRQFTIKLYEMRLAHYPKAFEITEKLRKDFLINNRNNKEQLIEISDTLERWHCKYAGFILSETSIKAWYDIRDALNAVIQNKGNEKNLIKRIWSAKNKFRSCLRKDVDLLYEEESFSKNED